MNHVLLGISIPFVGFMIIYACRKFRATLTMLTVTPLFMAATVMWAVAPDLPRLLGMRDFYMDLSRDSRCNMFLWHYTIDQIEADSPVFLAGVVAIMVSMLAVAWREVRLEEMRDTRGGIRDGG